MSGLKLTDDLLREALHIDRPAGPSADLMPAIRDALRSTRRPRLMLPWSAGLSARPSRPVRLVWAAILVALLMGMLVGVMLVVGSLLRPAFPLAGKVVVSAGQRLVFVDPSTGTATVELSGGITPTYSPDGKHIAYIVPGTRGLQIEIVGADGRPERTIALAPPASPGMGATIGYGVSWSADAGRLAFDADLAGASHVFVADREAGAPRDLTPSGVQFATPALSPDGRTIAVRALDANGSSVSPPRWQLWFVDTASGETIKRLEPLPDGYSALSGYSLPQWSPDATRIAFDAIRSSGQFRMFVVNVDGSGLRRLAPDLNPWTPLWSPDGQRILFESFDTGPSHHADAWLVGADGSGELEVAADADVWSWSADGSAVLYSSPSCASEPTAFATCVPGLYVFKLDGSGAKELVSESTLSGLVPAYSRYGFSAASWGTAP